MKIAELLAVLTLRTDKKSVDGVERVLGGIKRLAGSLIAIETARRVTGFFRDLVTETTAAASHFVELAEKTGIAIETLQELEYAGRQTGVGAQELQTGLQKLSMGLYDARNGSEQAQEQFKRMGLSWKDSTGAIRPVDSVLGDIADRFAAMPNGTAKTAEAMKLFGRSGAQLIPLLNGGRKGIHDLRVQAQALGIVLDGETAKSFEQFGDTTDDLKEAWRAVKQDIAVALLPTLKELATNLRSWFLQNRELIKQRIREYVQKFVDGVRAAWPHVKALIQGVADLVRWFIAFQQRTGALLPLLKAIGAAFVALKIFNFVKQIVSMTRALWALSAPVAPFIAALYGIVAAYDAITGGDPFPALSDAMASFFEWVDEKIRAFIDKIMAIPRAVSDAASAVRNYFGGGSGESVVVPLTEYQKRQKEMRAQGRGPARTAVTPGATGTKVDQKFDVTMNVTAPPGTDAEEVARRTRDVIRDWFSGEMRDTAAAVGTR